jgi:26S proteasome regulatory subunit N2
VRFFFFFFREGLKTKTNTASFPLSPSLPPSLSPSLSLPLPFPLSTSGAALCALGQGDLASDLVERLSADPDPLLRYGGAFATGLAFAGTASPAAVGRLLTAAVRDVSDDVRRAAVLNLGFVLAGEGAERVAAAVAPLSQSFNPHVRYGAAMALGVGCACGGARAALAALAPLLDDPVDFVRQGALVASALVLMQQPAAVAAPLRATLARCSTDKHEETMCR